MIGTVIKGKQYIAMSKSQRDKGKRGELEASRALSKVLGVPVWWSQQYHGAAGSADLAGVDGLHFEVKRTERLILYDAMEQAAGDCGDEIPIVIHRRNNKKWVTMVYLDDLMSLVQTLYTLQDQR